jgi:NAD(P)-dependent dehydrogenase (short-subunit alcohol dehydrogenase family)
LKVELNNKTALVTGAGRGIGRSIADGLARNGATVIYTDIDEPAAAESAGRFDNAHAMRMDVTAEPEVREVIHQTVANFGRLDILVNNAGVNTLDHRVTIDEFPREEWDRIIEVDLNGLYEVSRAGARVMKEQGAGRIINISSIAGLVALRLQSAFVAAKAAVVNLTKAMALELADHGILVNAIAPGSTLTDGTKDLFYGEDGRFKEAAQRLLEHIPLGRPAEVEEIAQAALFLADPDNSYMTGQVLVVDGGWTAGGYVRDF